MMLFRAGKDLGLIWFLGNLPEQRTFSFHYHFNKLKNTSWAILKMFLHYRTLQSLYFHVAGQHSFPLQFPLPLGRLRAGCSPMASLSSSKAPCSLTGQPELTEWMNSAACTQNCREILSRFSRFYRHFTLSSICWNLSGFHPILQGLFMPFTFHVYVKCTKNPWDKV